MNNDFKNIKAVLFDFDDTLGHRESYAYDTFYRLLKSCTDFEDEMELEAILQDVMIWDEQGNIHKQHIVDMLKQKGAKDVYIACTHGVLSGPAIERLSTFAAKEVVITNTIEIPQEKKFDKLVSVSVAGLLAHTIENIENDLPVSDVFTQYDC